MSSPPDGLVRCPGCNHPIMPGAEVVSVSHEDPWQDLWHRSCRQLTPSQIMTLRSKCPEFNAACRIALFSPDGHDRAAAHQVLSNVWAERDLARRPELTEKGIVFVRHSAANGTLCTDDGSGICSGCRVSLRPVTRS